MYFEARSYLVSHSVVSALSFFPSPVLTAESCVDLVVWLKFAFLLLFMNKIGYSRSPKTIRAPSPHSENKKILKEKWNTTVEERNRNTKRSKETIRVKREFSTLKKMLLNTSSFHPNKNTHPMTNSRTRNDMLHDLSFLCFPIFSWKPDSSNPVHTYSLAGNYKQYDNSIHVWLERLVYFVPLTLTWHSELQPEQKHSSVAGSVEKYCRL